MEDLKAYIESGILELYVLGQLTDAEKQEVEVMASRYPQIKSELDNIETGLFQYAENNAVAPSDHLRNKVLSSLETAAREEVHTIPLAKRARHTNFYKIAFAASFALLIISIFAIISLNRQLNNSYNKIAVLESANQKFSSHVNQLDTQLNKVQSELSVYKNRDDYQLVTLKGTSKAPQSSIVVAFNPKKEQVLIDLSSLNMPDNDKVHQYQLWALVDGKPVDLGVFDSSEKTATGMKKMNSIARAQAFAVTLEPKGGSKNPTLEQMMVMGSL